MHNQEHLAVLGSIYTILGILNLIVAVVFLAAMGAQAVLVGDAGAVMG